MGISRLLHVITYYYMFITCYFYFYFQLLTTVVDVIFKLGVLILFPRGSRLVFE